VAGWLADFTGFDLEVGIVHPGPREHWDGKKTTIPILWDCWLDFVYHPSESDGGNCFPCFFLLVFFWDGQPRRMVIGLCSSGCVGRTSQVNIQ
jgi:hypothetical protein